MTEQEKNLLFLDICGRLPYGVIVQYKQKTFYHCGEYTVDTKVEIDGMLHHRLKLLDFKPYLRPMSSMIEEEDARRCAFIDDIEGGVEDAIPNYIDWLNKKMFDYRGLIPMGLALPATEGMYKI